MKQAQELWAVGQISLMVIKDIFPSYAPTLYNAVIFINNSHGNGESVPRDFLSLFVLLYQQ